MRSDRMYEINDKLDEVRALFYNLLDFEEDDISEKKEGAKRELLFALNDLRNSAELL
ncbi:MAG: hypothetical protein LBU99_06195 [Spirochaetaceae bacterium]|jgi:hypothetical protein|nr:hypothetical protein [Spirochaetaceae bacterium]